MGLERYDPKTGESVPSGTTRRRTLYTPSTGEEVEYQPRVRRQGISRTAVSRSITSTDPAVSGNIPSYDPSTGQIESIDPRLDFGDVAKLGTPIYYKSGPASQRNNYRVPGQIYYASDTGVLSIWLQD